MHVFHIVAFLSLAAAAAASENCDPCCGEATCTAILSQPCYPCCDDQTCFYKDFRFRLEEYKEACPAVSEATCSAGVGKDRCNCCDVCLQGLGQPCGGPHNVAGKCGNNLRCKITTFVPTEEKPEPIGWEHLIGTCTAVETET